jgi:hypothetical protein
MVRRGSTVRVRQRASEFLLLICGFRVPTARRLSVPTSTERPPTSTARSGGADDLEQRAAHRHGRGHECAPRSHKQLAPQDDLWYSRARASNLRIDTRPRAPNWLFDGRRATRSMRCAMRALDDGGDPRAEPVRSRACRRGECRLGLLPESEPLADLRHQAGHEATLRAFDCFANRSA